MSSRRKRILEALAARLRQVQIRNGFDTDVGLALYWGPVVLGPDDPPMAVAIVPGATETNPNQSGKKVIVLPVEIHAAVRESEGDAWLQAETVLSDIKRAVELDDRTLAGLAVEMEAGEVIPLLREEGGMFLGLRTEYRIIYGERWGQPEG